MASEGINPAGVVRAVGVAAGLLAVGAAAGAVAERAVVARSGRADPEADEPFGKLRGTPLQVRDAQGGALHVEVEPSTRDHPDDLTIIFSHGYALNQDCWHYQRRDLRALGRLVFWDQRSHGRSGRSLAETNTLDQLGQDLETVLEAVAPEGPVVLVGHSMGGMTIMSLALQRPELFGSRVRGVALLSTSPGGLRDVPLGLPAFAAKPLHRVLPVTAAVLMRNADLVEMGRSRVNDLSLLFTRFYSFGSQASPALADFTHRMLGETPIDVVAEFLPTLQQHDRKAALRVLGRVPALVMVGQEDRMTPAAHSLDMARRMPRSELEVVPDSGHMMILEHFAQVNQRLRELVARVRDDLAREGAERDELLAEAGLTPQPGSDQPEAGLRLPQP
ncbi:MAG: alpha/beta hydrolase [Candidatus Nanopelagicales bacterium]|jgi:pimeloyl-ACP methyl ester carboxylesterase|nr:alpha/beta hydrolase [Candidatus Nanopelagicales bacterium]